MRVLLSLIIMSVTQYVRGLFAWLFHQCHLPRLSQSTTQDRPVMSPRPFQRKVYCAFSDDLKAAFSVDCVIDHDTYDDIKQKLQQRNRLQTFDIDQWTLYRPGRVLDKDQVFRPNDKDSRLPSKFTIKSTDPESLDPEVDIIIVVKSQPAFVKWSVTNEFAMGTITILYYTPLFHRTLLTAQASPYRPPNPGALVNSPGRQWDYQASDELKGMLHYEVQRHFSNYTDDHIDKTTIPLYLFLSGAGTGKSRNAAELDKTIHSCFDGTYFDKNEQLASQLRTSFVFHVSFENGTSLRIYEDDPWKAIGTRMLLQALQVDGPPEKRITVDDVLSRWYQPTPDEIIKLVPRDGPSALERRTIYLIVDGLHNISNVFGEFRMFQILTHLGDLAHSGFIIICGTSTVSGPFDRLLAGSRRRRIPLPCSPLDPPRIDNKPVFDTTDIVRQVLVSDCGGHGRAFELLVDVFHMLPADISSDVKYLIAKNLQLLYSGVLPSEGDSIAIVKAVLANRCLPRYAPIPGTQITPDEICQNGLIRFTSSNPGTSNPVGHFSIPYIWLLTLCLTYEGSQFFDELQLFDYRDFRSMENPTLPGAFNWSDFEKLMVKIRKIKSHVFHDGEVVTLGDVHRGAIMTRETGNITLINHHLQDDVSVHRISTITTPLNGHTWVVKTACAGQVDIRSHKYVIQNGHSASAGDAVLPLDTTIPRTESHQYKNVQAGRLRFHEERAKAAGIDDIFILFCTSSVPSLRDHNGYHVPHNTIIVDRENWNSYFGPYAARSYLLAKQVRRISDQECSDKGDD